MENESKSNDERRTGPWYRAGLRFECTGCSECCKARGAYSHVYAAEREFTAMARLLKKRRADFDREFTTIDADGRRELRFERGACVFLAADGRCGVYAARPTQCRTFPFWSENLVKRTWELEIAPGCEGVGRGKRYTRGEIEAIAREADRAG
jgi:Fe-S-cluster containining protein